MLSNDTEYFSLSLSGNNNNVSLTYILQSLVLLLQFRVDLHEGLLSLVKLVLDGLDLLLESASLFLSLRKSKCFITTLRCYSVNETSAYISTLLILHSAFFSYGSTTRRNLFCDVKSGELRNS